MLGGRYYPMGVFTLVYPIAFAYVVILEWRGKHQPVMKENPQ